MRKISLLIALMISAVVQLNAQVAVKGKVFSSKDNSPLEGITVKDKSSGRMIATNSDGSFTLNTESSSPVLEFSGIGFENKTMKAQAGKELIVMLDVAAGKMGGEVIVTAYGIARSKNTLPYSAQKIGGSDVSASRGGNFVNNLSGKVSGLETRQNNTMGGSTNVVLRGAKSLTGNNQALFVIDGIPFDNSTNNSGSQARGGGGYDYGNGAADINPDDIENITILKGAAASALYGSRGSNGAILITTKKGKKGLGVTVNSGFTMSSILRNTFPTYQKKYGAGYGAYFDAVDIDGDGNDDNVVPTYDDASWGNAFDPTLNVYQWSAFIPGSPNYLKATPWVAAKNDPSTFFEKPVSFNNSVFMETGNDKGSLVMGYTRNNERGVLPNSSLDKDLLNFSTTYKVRDNLTLGMSANYSGIRGKGRFGTGYDGANALNPMTNFRQWWQVNVDMKELENMYLLNSKNNTWNMVEAFSGALQPIYWDNPYFSRYKCYQTDSRNRYFGNVFFNYKANSWLDVTGRVTMDNYSDFIEERKAISSVGVPFYSRFNKDYSEINYDLIANGNWDLSDKMNLKAILGSNTRIQSSSSISAATNGGLGLPDLYTLSNSINTPEPPSEFAGTRRVEGVFGGGTLTYDNTYTLDVTVRRDRSSTLPEKNNVYFYPSVSAGMVFSNLMKADWLSYGKVRANYAEVGGDAPLFSVKDYYVTDDATSFNGTALFSVSGIKRNDNLKPERTKSTEFGLEMSFLKSRVGFDLTYYDAKTVDQILPLTVSTATGYSSKFVNSGTVQNKGIELSLYATPVKTNDFAWDVNVNYTRNRSKVTELYGDLDNIVLGSFQGSITVNATVGEAYGSIHGTDYVYTNGQPTVDADGNYLISSTNNITIGNVNPDWIGGITNKFTYKNLSLSALIDIRQGGSVFSTDMYYGLAGGLYEETAINNDLGNPIRNALADGGGIIRPGVTEDGQPNTIRADVSEYGAYDSYVSSPDKRFVYDASYVKLRDVSIGYTIPMKYFGSNFNKYVKGLELSLVGRNLAILHKNLPYADPEDTFGSGNLQGIQCGTYPGVRSIAFNLKVKL